MDDKQIIEKVLSGDNDAFSELVERYQQRVYNLALRMTGNNEDAFDLSQEAFFRAWQGLKGFHFEAGFSTWLYRLTSNLCIDFLRSQKRRKTVSLTVGEEADEETQLELPDPQPGPEELAVLAQSKELLVRAMNELEPEQRSLLTMLVINDMSYADIASATGLKEGTVKSRLSRARERLRKKLLQFGNKAVPASSIVNRGGDAR